MSDERAIPEVHGVDREIASTLIDTGAINFEAIGQTVSKIGAKTVFVDDGWERICGSTFRVFRWPNPHGLAELEQLREIVRSNGLG